MLNKQDIQVKFDKVFGDNTKVIDDVKKRLHELRQKRRAQQGLPIEPDFDDEINFETGEMEADVKDNVPEDEIESTEPLDVKEKALVSTVLEEHYQVQTELKKLEDEGYTVETVDSEFILKTSDDQRLARVYAVTSSAPEKQQWFLEVFKEDSLKRITGRGTDNEKIKSVPNKIGLENALDLQAIDGTKYHIMFPVDKRTIFVAVKKQDLTEEVNET